MSRRGTAPELTRSPHEILRGLAPSLIADLAALSGSTMDDLRVTLQIMPYADRLTLQAYGLINMGGDTSVAGGRTVHLDSLLILDVIVSAAEATAHVARAHLIELAAYVDAQPDS